MWDQLWNADSVCKSDSSCFTTEAQFEPQAVQAVTSMSLLAIFAALRCRMCLGTSSPIWAEPSLTKVIWFQHMSLPTTAAAVWSQMWRRPTLCHLHSLITSQMLPLALCACSNLVALAPLSPWGHNVDRSRVRGHMHQSISCDFEPSSGLPTAYLQFYCSWFVCLFALCIR